MTLAVHSLLSTSEKKEKQFMILPSCRSVFSHQCKVQWGKPQRPLWLYSCLASETLAEGVREHFQTQFYWSFQFRGFLWVLVKIFLLLFEFSVIVGFCCGFCFSMENQRITVRIQFQIYLGTYNVHRTEQKSVADKNKMGFAMLAVRKQVCEFWQRTVQAYLFQVCPGEIQSIFVLAVRFSTEMSYY